MTLTRSLYRLARFSNDASAVASGDPIRVGRRVKNRAIGRFLIRRSWWRAMWRLP